MNEQRNEKGLDELISKAIDTSEPKFDAEKWKQKYPGQFQSLVERRSQRSSASRVGVLSMVLKRRMVKLAAAAVIIVAIGFFIVHQQPSEQADTTIVSKVTKSPTEMLTVASLNIAYRKGGLEAVEAQFEKALYKRIPQPSGISPEELLEDFNG